MLFKFFNAEIEKYFLNSKFTFFILLFDFLFLCWFLIKILNFNKYNYAAYYNNEFDINFLITVNIITSCVQYSIFKRFECLYFHTFSFSFTYRVRKSEKLDCWKCENSINFYVMIQKKWILSQQLNFVVNIWYLFSYLQTHEQVNETIITHITHSWHYSVTVFGCAVVRLLFEVVKHIWCTICSDNNFR